MIEETATPAPTIDLAAPRGIALKIDKTLLRFTFPPIPAKVWRTFLASVITRVEQRLVDGVEQRTRINDEDAALVTLFDQCSEISGYTGTEGLTLAQLRARVPLRHKLAVAQILRGVGAAIGGDGLALTEFAEVQLECPWTCTPDGVMQMFSGLIHRFKQPTIDQFRRWRAGTSRTQVSGDAANGVTVYPSRLTVALSLYDELIAEVEGYTVNGEPLADVKQIAAHMDAMHKARAVLELFERDEEDISLVGPPPATGDDVPAADAAEDEAAEDDAEAAGEAQ